ncbi:MOSC domain-containing protein [Gayadomonas joobiniege]|uniref:MOSC domain-containing protein n=1 Tax=Gayadomonas joobiniege TaxID=1234606 RepID=UPI00037658E4|nr:MOSC domain-containing protein [Gayadomonas joobiniege]
MSDFNQLRSTHAQIGKVTWIGIRPQRRAPLQPMTDVWISELGGLDGDHYYAPRHNKRQVTLIQAEHLAVMAALLNVPEVTPQQLRRNIVVAGINLLAFKDSEFLIGEVVLRGTGLCHPCRRMDEAFGPGGYNAVRGHGGITATVVRGGRIQLQDEVKAL